MKTMPRAGVLARYMRELAVGDSVRVRYKFRAASYVTKIVADENSKGGERQYKTDTSGNVYAIVTRIK